MGAFTRQFSSVVDSVVTESSEFDGEDYDLIVGMDVIQNGDLAVTNFNDITTFSFRIPSKKVIDFELDK